MILMFSMARTVFNTPRSVTINKRRYREWCVVMMVHIYYIYENKHTVWYSYSRRVCCIFDLPVMHDASTWQTQNTHLASLACWLLVRDFHPAIIYSPNPSVCVCVCMRLIWCGIGSTVWECASFQRLWNKKKLSNICRLNQSSPEKVPRPRARETPAHLQNIHLRGSIWDWMCASCVCVFFFCLVFCCEQWMLSVCFRASFGFVQHLRRPFE